MQPAIWFQFVVKKSKSKARNIKQGIPFYDSVFVCRHMKILAVDSKPLEENNMDIGCVVPGGHIIKQ